MKRMFSALGLVIAAAIATPVHAQNYPWCEFIGGGMGEGGRNCGFVSYEQCMASAFGNGGDCRPNTMYTPPPGPHHGEMGYEPAPSIYQHYRAHKKSTK